MVYFMADSHLGSSLFENRDAETARLCRWLRHVSRDASAIYMLGDVFDFWYEFARSVPPGFDVLLDTMREVVADGVPIHFFPGNHDQWTYGYLSERCGLTVHSNLELVEIYGRRFLLAHGHGLGEQRRVTRMLNAVFENRALRWLFRHAVVPRWGLAFGYRWSACNRRKHDAENIAPDDRIDYYAPHSTDSGAFQVCWAKEYVKAHSDVDYIVMGHLHKEINMMLGNGTRLLIPEAFYLNGAYAAFDGENFCLENFEYGE